MGGWEEALAESALSDFEGDFAFDHVNQPPPVPTGIRALDEALGGGLPAGEVTVVAGDPGAGKTALVAQVTVAAALAGLRPAYVSIEMSRHKCLARMVSCHARRAHGLDVPWSSRPDEATRRSARKLWHVPDPVRRREMQRSLARRVLEGGEDPMLRAWQRFDADTSFAGGLLVTDSARGVSEICDLMEGISADGAGRLVGVDYAQLVETDDPEEYERMGTVSRSLRLAAKTCASAVALISATRKLTRSDRSAGPSIDWLKGNSQLGYDAGLVMFLTRPETEGDVAGGLRTVRLHVVKNRNGMLCDPVELTFDARHNFMYGDGDQVPPLGGGR